ncbi:MAG: hypothetical protein E6J91_01860, partial [Deltaproteobacteria bacterium]
MPIAVGGVALIVVLVVVVIAFSGGKPRPSTQPAPAPVAVKPPPPPPPDPSTGFDLYVTPAGITQWKLDGEARTDRLPSRIRGIAPGPHTVQIEPPPGFLSQHQQVAVEAGRAPKVTIELQPIPGISGIFDSTPPGASVSLIIDGKREKPGYVSVNRPISFSGALEEHVVVNLEKIADAPAPPPALPAERPPRPPSPPAERPHRVSRPAPDRPAPDRPEPGPVTEPPSPAAPDEAPETRPGPDARAKQGILVLGSKPPCDITIDGIATNLHTPQKEIKLAVGKHRVTLTN